MEQKPNSDETLSLSKEVMGALADALGVSFLTIQRWVNKKDIRLTTEKAREVFQKKGIDWSAVTSELTS